MAAFPTTLSCTVTSGFKEILPETTMYLGGETYTDKGRATVDALIDSHSDMEDFTRWYITDLSWGTLPFTITLPLFGVTRAWNVKLTKAIDIEHINDSAINRTINMDLEIQDDIDTYISV